MATTKLPPAPEQGVINIAAARTLLKSKLLAELFDERLNTINESLLAEEDREKREQLWQQHRATRDTKDHINARLRKLAD